MAEQKKKPGRPPGSKNKTTAGAGAKDAKIPKEQRVKMTAEQLAKKKRIHDEIWAIILIAVGAFLAISLQTEATGQVGHTLQVFFKGSFGFLAFILPYYLILYGLLLFARRTAHIGGRSVFFLILIYLMATIMNSTRFLEAVTEKLSFDLMGALFEGGVELENGGVFGMSVGLLLDGVIGVTGIWILCGVVVIISILLVVNTPFAQFLDSWKLKRQAARKEQAEEDETIREAQALMAAEAAASSAVTAAETTAREKAAMTAPRPKPEAPAAAAGAPLPGGARPQGPLPRTTEQMQIIDYMKDDSLFGGSAGAGGLGYGLEEAAKPAAGLGLDSAEPVKTQPGLGLDGSAPDAAAARARLIGKEGTEALKTPEIKVSTEADPDYIMPSIDLLEKPRTTAKPGENAELKARARKLEDTLQNFGVNAHILQVTKGPTVTRYEVQPDVGVKVSSIVRLADDIALNLEAKSIRIEAPIPGKAAIGIEVENERVNMVVLREILDSREFKSAKSKITFAVGKDISGNAIVADLKSMPHMLIAGSTGSGKSVCINSIILSILYKARPEEVKFVLVDPKVVELRHYNDIPHMLIPVVTEPSKAAAALNWAVAEMTDRYKKFAEAGVRDLESFNNVVTKNGETDRVLPQIVIVIDELADLMMAAPSQVEEAICRLAQMARAAGMHLIVATQRPSVDVITGVIKANIPSRVAFAVSSQFDSRTILDMSGAEKLMGKGDMLFNPLGIAKPLRVQGAFVSDQEVRSVIDFLKGQNKGAEQQYAGDVIASIEQGSNGGGGNHGETDELLPDAIETVVRAEQASVSMLQRRFRIGYNRAARLVDMMEERGVIGPADGSRPRQVLLSVDQWMAINAETEAGETPEG